MNSIANLHVRLYTSGMAQCFFCGAEIPAKTKIYRNTLCDHCGNPLKICRNCTFYDSGAPHECLEHISEPVRDKEAANFCEFFVLDPYAGSGKHIPQDHTKAKDDFNSLFSD